MDIDSAFPGGGGVFFAVPARFHGTGCGLSAPANIQLSKIRKVRVPAWRPVDKLKHVLPRRFLLRGFAEGPLGVGYADGVGHQIGQFGR